MVYLVHFFPQLCGVAIIEGHSGICQLQKLYSANLWVCYWFGGFGFLCVCFAFLFFSLFLSSSFSDKTSWSIFILKS